MLAKKIYSSPSSDYSTKHYERYALYFVPASHTKLADFGQAWFGSTRDGDKNKPQAFPFGLDETFHTEITQKPSRYGLHATLKAPFYLSYNRSIEELAEQIQNFASNRRVFDIPKLHLSTERQFIALTAEKHCLKIDQLASQCVLAFDEFRAPLSIAERTRRLQAADLTNHQRVMLETLGYPYVLSEFHFHMTLTCKLPDEKIKKVKACLEPALESILSEPLTIDAIALAGDPGASEPFEIIERFPLQG